MADINDINELTDTEDGENSRNRVLVVGTPPKAPKKGKAPRRDMTDMKVGKTVSGGTVTVLSGNKSKREPLPLGIILTIVVLTVLALFMMLNLTEVERISASIGELEAEVATLKTERRTLEAELEKNEDLTYIEEYARTVLGMEKPTKKFPISLRPADGSDIVGYYEGEEGQVETIFSSFAEMFRNFFAKK